MIFRSTLVLALGIVSSMPCSAQLSYGGRPIGSSAVKLSVVQPPVEEMAAFDVDALRAADELRQSQKSGPWYYGKNFETDISTTNSGVWDVLPNGDRLWRVTIRSKGAFGINFEFHDYDLPAGGQVFVYTPDMKHTLGAFDQRNRMEDKGHGVLGVQSLPGDEIIVEYREPAAVLGEGNLKIGQVTHAYRDIWSWMKGLGDSGACNNNVICPVGDPYRPDISSVAIITTGGNGFCTGTVINNCAQDSTPYFLTANHCVSGSVATWVFRFHWESPDCATNVNGPINYTVSGATLLVNSTGTDVALLEMASNIPDTFKVCFAGWDHSGIAPDSTYGIHHPSGDVKKFSFDYDPPTQTTWSGADVWEVGSWDDGTTEPGSSGSGLWSNNGHLIGQLFGGSASCTSISNDDYGRIDVSWPLLEPYLGTCGPILDRFCPNGSFGGGSTGGGGGGTGQTFDLDVGISSIQEVEFIYCNDSTISPKITIKNHGNDWVDSVRVNWQWDAGAINGQMFVGQITTLQTANLFLPSITLSAGTHTLSVFTSDPNDQVDQNMVNDTASIDVIAYLPSINITFDLSLDDFGTETTWELHDIDGTLLHSGGPYTDGNAGTVERTIWCLGTGCYELSVYDLFGDGICCSQGNGWYSVHDSLTTSYVYGNGNFGSSITHQFCTVSVGVGDKDDTHLTMHPNPTTGMLNLNIVTEFIGAELRVFSTLGALVHQVHISQSGQQAIDLSHLNGGMYVVELSTGDRRLFGRVVKE